MTELPSRLHPHATPFGLVWTRAMLRPLAATMLAVMIGSLLYALLERDPLVFVVWWTPVALAVSLVWSAWSLRQRPASLRT